MENFFVELEAEIQNDPTWDPDPESMKAYVADLMAKATDNPTGPESQKLEEIKRFIRTTWAGRDSVASAS